jgi:hypothetical protein
MRATRARQNSRRDMVMANELARLPALADAWKQAILTPSG